jgi:hypothetical protein
MLAFKPAHRVYPGDQNMRVSTQQNSKDHVGSQHSGQSTKHRRPARCVPIPEVVAPVGRVTKDKFVLESRRCASIGKPPHSRLCGDLTHLQNHINTAVTAIKRPKVCHICGEPAYSMCGLCEVMLHYFSKRGTNAGAECYLLYHSDAFFGLAKHFFLVDKLHKQ